MAFIAYGRKIVKALRCILDWKRHTVDVKVRCFDPNCGTRLRIVVTLLALKDLQTTSTDRKQGPDAHLRAPLASRLACRFRPFCQTVLHQYFSCRRWVAINDDVPRATVLATT